MVLSSLLIIRLLPNIISNPSLDGKLFLLYILDPEPDREDI